MKDYPSYFQIVKWARLECKSHKIPEPNTDFADNEEPGDMPFFCVEIEIDL